MHCSHDCTRHHNEVPLQTEVSVKGLRAIFFTFLAALLSFVVIAAVFGCAPKPTKASYVTVYPHKDHPVTYKIERKGATLVPTYGDARR